jgi:hypothetical protein
MIKIRNRELMLMHRSQGSFKVQSLPGAKNSVKDYIKVHLILIL